MSETKMLKVWIPAAIYDAFHTDAVKRFSKDSAWAREIILQHYGHIEGVESQVVGPGRPLGSGKKTEVEQNYAQPVQSERPVQLTPVYQTPELPIAAVSVTEAPPVDSIKSPESVPVHPVVPTLSPATPIRNPYLQRVAAKFAGS